MCTHTRSHALAMLTTLALCALGLSACTTSMTTTTEARAYEPKEVQVAAVMTGNAHTNIIGPTVRGIQSAAEQFEGDGEISEEAYRDWLDVAIAGALFRPGTSPEVMARVGVTDKFLEGVDVGVRSNFKLIKGELKTQLWENENADQALSVMLGYAYHFDVVSSALSYLTLTDFGRHDFDLQVLWGANYNDIVKMTLAPHVIISRVTAEHRLPDSVTERLPDDVKRFDPNQLFRNEWMGYYGMNAVLMVGYKYVFATVDAGAFWLNFNPEVLGEERRFSGLALNIAGGVSVNYPF